MPGVSNLIRNKAGENAGLIEPDIEPDTEPDRRTWYKFFN